MMSLMTGDMVAARDDRSKAYTVTECTRDTHGPRYRLHPINNLRAGVCSVSQEVVDKNFVRVKMLATGQLVPDERP